MVKSPRKGTSGNGGGNGRITLKWIIRNSVLVVGIEINWFTIVPNGGILLWCAETSGTNIGTSVMAKTCAT